MGVGASTVMTEDEEMERRANEAKPITVSASKFLVFVANEEIVGQSIDDYDTIKNLNFGTEAINRLFSLFGIGDYDGKNVMTLRKYYNLFDIERTPFNKKLVMLFDFDASGEVDFLEFVCSIWNLGTWGKDDLPRLIFNVYDTEMMGYIPAAECLVVVKEMFANRTEKLPEETLLLSLEKFVTPGNFEYDRRVYQKDFIAWCDDFPQILQPFSCMQKIIQQQTFGVKFWDTVGKEMREWVLDDLELDLRERFGECRAEYVQRNAYDIALKEKHERKRQRAHAKLLAKQGLILNPNQGDDSSSSEDEDQDEDTVAVAKKPKVHQSVRDAKKRVQIFRALHKEKVQDTKRWDAEYKYIMNEGDPMIQILRYQDPDLFNNLRAEFDSRWRKAEFELRGELYKPPATKNTENVEVYFQSKCVDDLPEDLLPQRVWSIARGKDSPLMKKWMRPKERKKVPEVNELEIAAAAEAKRLEIPTDSYGKSLGFKGKYGNQNHKRAKRKPIPEEQGGFAPVKKEVPSYLAKHTG